MMAFNVTSNINPYAAIMGRASPRDNESRSAAQTATQADSSEKDSLEPAAIYEPSTSKRLYARMRSVVRTEKAAVEPRKTRKLNANNDNVQGSQYGPILQKLHTGQMLTHDEMSFLQSYYPKTHAVVAQFVDERAKMEKELRDTGAKQDMQKAISEAGAVSGNQYRNSGVDITLSAESNSLSGSLTTIQFGEKEKVEYASTTERRSPPANRTPLGNAINLLT